MRRSLVFVVLSLSVLLSTLVTAQDASYTFTTIDVPNSYPTHANGINNQGQIVGTYASFSGGSYSFVLSIDSFTIFNHPSATVYTSAEGINARGQIVGSYSDSDGSLPPVVSGIHGFLLSAGHFTTIDVPSSFETVTFGIKARL